ncbi:hypothetical protein [Candidatus Hakubella thermalkaliphila]|uniref:Uncharacterized protein n=2 Tax=Candidatus Hakubella thermalkaliphila TaxID=2754717 RepID=A0A6V8QDJ1_9ACTN|nr:hypothetical protein [Candidatus Hakubella thermalkaliphila]GFP28289.1 hypothetical protein HKBW3S33_01704 [Candidatus Hakubella thermalkaliphila]GFP41376.1 hypothetical protein HKBW3C_00502 [Candidatus Hakubella thermalkaliphila]
MSYYDDLNQKSYEIERFINTFPLLSSVFTPHFFEDVRAQIEEMRRLGLSSSLHSMFIFFRDDSENGYQKTRRLEDYLTKIFSHCSTGERNYIKSEFTRLQCLNTLFEVSILGNLLSQLPQDRVRLYPQTVGQRSVDAEIVLISRPVYLEMTVLAESQADRDVRELMMGVRCHHWLGSRNLDKDADRFIRKLLEKSAQFIPGQPNVLAISVFDWFPADFEIEPAMRDNCYLNLGMVLQFGRARIEHVFTNNCDPSCQLTDQERDRLVELLSGQGYFPLAYL